jgi:hypothetical protein
MRLVILSELLAFLIFAGACSQYNEDKKVEAENRAAYAESVRKEQGEAAAEKLHVAKPKERIEEVARITPTPTATPNLLNRQEGSSGSARRIN